MAKILYKIKTMNLKHITEAIGLFGLTLCIPITAQTHCKTENGEMRELWGKDCFSGVYPHLTTYAHGRRDGTYHYGDECGIGALAVWGDKLYMVNYAAHRPQGSEHKLYIIDKDRRMTVFPGSVGGTPAARMIHAESEQLLIGHYLIDKQGKIRTISPSVMPGRITAIARHLKDPAHLVYYYDMEGMLYEANVYTLEVKKLYHNPLPGWHGKGGYTAQGRLVLSNNGEAAEDSKLWQVDKTDVNGPECCGVLAEFDGDKFRIVERRQFTDVTTRHGIRAVPNDQSPLWTMGWDKRAVRLKVMENGRWTTFLLPKATYNNDPAHGWFTEWPRIREIGNGKIMMDMHGMFFDLPANFSSTQTAGIRPIASHLRYIPDFCSWDGQIVMATDETSIQGNPLAGQPQSNLWFGTLDDLHTWGPATGYGAIWLADDVQTGTTSDPYLFAGFDRRMAHVVNHRRTPVSLTVQIDKKGNGQWTDYRTLRLKGNEYLPLIFPKDLQGEWIRLRASGSGNVSFVLHYTAAPRMPDKSRDDLFAALADADSHGPVLRGKLFANRANLNLTYLASVETAGQRTAVTPFEFDKFRLRFTPGLTDSLALRALGTKVHYADHMQFDAQTVDPEQMKTLWDTDEASVILYTSKGRLRLPRGNRAFDNYKNTRCIREVESERELAHIHGTFYELPLEQVGCEPRFTMMRPVASHSKLIDDFASWNGLLVMTGISRDAGKSAHVYHDKSHTAAIWLGAIDDLWQLGKPVGIGGPWMHTPVKQDQLSDPYLMTGYDRKTLTLSADKATTVSLWVNVSHDLDDKLLYKEFQLQPNKPLTYTFPEGFSAHWVYLSADCDCHATAQFVYE